MWIKSFFRRHLKFDKSCEEYCDHESVKVKVHAKKVRTVVLNGPFECSAVIIPRYDTVQAPRSNSIRFEHVDSGDEASGMM